MSVRFSRGVPNDDHGHRTCINATTSGTSRLAAVLASMSMLVVDARIRVLLPSAVAGPGYLAGFSRGVVATR